MRRIIYNKQTGDIVSISSGETIINVEEMGIIMQDENIDKDKFAKCRSFKVNLKTNKIEFNEMNNIKTKDEQIKELENELLISKEKEIGGIM